MRRVFATLTTTALLLACGCGGRSYELRLETTYNNMQYKRRLDNNLMPPATKTKLETLNIYVRPPKPLDASKEFLLTALEPGKFDDAESFSDKQAQLHILARVKLPKAAPKKGAPAPPPNTRGEFVTDVVGLLNSVYNVEVDAAKAKEDTKKNNRYKRLLFEGNGKDVQVYFYGAKSQPYEIALIFEYPKTEAKSISPKIELALESFATGQKAQSAFTGGGEAEAEAAGEGATAAPVAF
jgi:hypothetical protein